MNLLDFFEDISSQQRGVGQLPANFKPPKTSPQLSGPYPGRNATRGYLVGEDTEHPAYRNLRAIQQAATQGHDAEIFFAGSDEPTRIEYPLARHLASKYRAMARTNSRDAAQFIASLLDARRFDLLTKQYGDIVDRARKMGQGMRESLRSGEYHIATVTLDDGTQKKVRITSDEGFRAAIEKHFARQGQKVTDIDVDWSVRQDLGEDAGGEDNPMIQAVHRRIVFNRPEWITKYGVDAIDQAIIDVVGEHWDGEEIGSSDVSAYIRMIGEYLRDRMGSREEMDDRQPFAEGAETATEDVISAVKRKLGDYLQDVATAIQKDPDLMDKVDQAIDQVGPAVKTIRTDDGHEIKIHGNEDDGFRISIRNRAGQTKFKDLDEATMACEMYCSHRRQKAMSADYIEEKHTTLGEKRDRSPGKITKSEDPCWSGYHMVGTKKKGSRTVPNCVPGKKGD